MTDKHFKLREDLSLTFWVGNYLELKLQKI